MVSSTNRSYILKQLSDLGIVPVIRSDSLEWAFQAINKLIQIGFKTFEITMTIPNATDLIKKLSTNENLLIGAGTVTDVKQTEQCIQAGARYLVSPCIVQGLPDLCQEADVVSILSGLTPSEVLTAWQLGCDAVKVFPAQSVGGPEHIRALKSIFPHIPLIPTGGVNLGNLTEYFLAGSTLVGVGSDLVNHRLFEQAEEDGYQFGADYLHSIKEIKVGGKY